MLPSFQLSKNPAGIWICTGEMPGTGRPFRFEAGTGSREKAEGLVEGKLRAKLASSTGSKARWAKAKAAPATPGSPGSTPPAAPRPSDDDLRAKLLHLGDVAPPLEPDQVIPADADGAAAGAAGDTEDTAEELDSEGQELIAALLAKGATLGLVGLTNRQLRKRKPPQEGEPHEWGLEHFEKGLTTVCMKIVGRTATLGPAGQIFVGGLVIVGSMYMSAEPIEPQPAAAAAASSPAPAPPAPEPQPTSNGAGPPQPTTAIALGVFGVEKRTVVGN